jgi:hypothetical protein
VSNLAKNAGSGGFIEFRTADNGVSYIDRWEGRLLALGSVPRVSDAGGPTATAGSPLQVDGGQPITLRWPDGTVVKKTLPTFTGRVVDAKTKEPVPGITISFESTPYEAVTDSTGSFRLDEVLPGPYAITLTDSLWEPFGLGRGGRIGVSVNDSSTQTRTIEIPSLDVAVAARCRGVKHGNGPVFIAGLMTDVAGRPIAGTIDAYLGGVGASAPVTLRVEPTGVFTLCGLDPRRIVIVARNLDGNQKAFDYVVPATGTVHPFIAIIPR